jgi:hypothetical protein
MAPLIPPGGSLGFHSLIEWGTAQSVLAGQAVSGDRYLLKPYLDGLLVAVVDGLGHGEKAAAAADIAVATLETHSREPVIPLLKRCHEALKRTRGAAISLASFSAVYDSMTWLGVGNVEGVLLRADGKAIPAQELIMLFPGVAGYQLPYLRAVVTPLNSGDLVIFFTDGVRRDFLSEPIPAGSPQLIAGHICDKYRKSTDDALVFVGRYLGIPR